MKKSKFSGRSQRPAYLNRRGYNDDMGGNHLSTYFVIDLMGGPTLNCNDMHHAFAVAWGRNKRTQTQNFCPCMMIDGLFHMLDRVDDPKWRDSHPEFFK